MKSEAKARNTRIVDDSDSNSVAPAKLYFNDPGEKNSWYYAASSRVNIDIEPIWDEYRGSGIKVGVLDTQIDYRHIDLAKAYDLALDYNFALKTSNPQFDPLKLPGNHGTRVAGVIAAEGNNESGSVGIAPEVTLVGLGIDYNAPSSVNDILAGLNAAVTLDVVNNSWSFTQALADNFATKPNYEAPLLKLATEGRGGLGTNIVFAAGNDGDDSTSNYHNFQNSPFAIAVGAVEADGDAARFSSRGANVLLSAAGVGVYTTNLGGGSAMADGTSFAAPAVSGAIALMLEANPELGYRDVQQILAYSSVRQGLDTSPIFSDGWQYNGAANHNGGGLHFNDAFGFGFLNVHNAVRLAETWQSQSTIANRSTFTHTVNPNVVLANTKGSTASLTIEVTDSLSLEHVRLSLKTNYGDASDLNVYLVSPEGTRVRLVYDVDEYASKVGSISGFTFTSVASLGESAKGIWTVELVNNRSGSDNKKAPLVVTVSEATLTLHGSTLALENDTYIYTDEFINFYADEDIAARSKLADSDGGIDTVNTAAVEAAVVIDLSGVVASNIGGRAFQITANQIENLYTGDGEDRVFGSSVNNVIATGRGDDELSFSLGKDQLDGGQGNDTLLVENALASYDVKVLAEGTVYVSAGGNVYSMISNVEIFKFGSQSYTVARLKSLLGVSDTAPVSGDGESGGGTGGDTGGETGGDTGGGAGGDTGGGTGGGTGEEDPDYSQYFTIFEGTDRNDQQSGSARADLLRGGGGKDNLSGGLGDDFIDGGVGVDKLRGQDGADTIHGGSGADSLVGGNGDDLLWGGVGADELSGGAGADTFVFNLADIGSIDIITDFNVNEGDRIVLAGLSQTSPATHSFVMRNAAIYLQVEIGDQTYELAKLKGVNLDPAALNTVEVDLLFV